MFMGLGMPIPDLSNKPGPGRPGYPTGAYEFQFEVDGQVTFKADAAAGGGSFSIKWPDGSSQSYSGSNASITAPDATAGVVSINNKLDTSYCDEFAVTSGEDKVKKVISWGERPWRDLSFAFSNCPNLTKIENTKLIGAANCNLGYLFFNCTGLTEALCENWDLSLGCEMRYLFESCTNLELLNLTGSKLPSSATAASNFSFHEVGSTTTNGCEFKMSGLDFTGTINAPGRQWFKLAKFKAGSNLSNWTFDSALNSFNATDLFTSATVNGTLDVSNWNWPSQQFPSFNSVNGGLTSRNGSKIKLTNFDVSVVNNFASAFASCKVDELEGLSTWGACAGNASMFRMFSGATLMAFNASDNFSDTFVASLTPTYVNEAFYNFSLSLPDSDFGPCPNLNGLDFSNLTSASTNGLLRFMRNSKWNNTPDFSNTTFSSTDTVSFQEAFRSFKTTGTGSNSIFNFNPTTIKPANFNSSWYFAQGLTELNIGSNVDMSSMTSVNTMLYAINNPSNNATPFTNATFATNADFSSLTAFSNWVAFAGQVLSVCQMDNFIRRLRATNNNSNITVDFVSCKITEAPALVRSDIDYFTNTKGWNITLATPDATLPFAYASYAVDPTGITTISPTTTPPAGSVFTATNSLSIDSSTGVITINTFRGDSTIRCTYPDGCYNEVVMLIQVPFVMKRLIPAAGQTALVGTRGSQYIEWGDGTAETNTGTASHAYSAAGTGFGTWRTIKIFDKSSTEKFTGMTASGSYYDRVNIEKWGDPVFDYLRFVGVYALGIRTAANDPLNTTSLTSFEQMFVSDGSYKTNARLIDPYNNLDTWKTSTATNGGAITTFKNMFANTSSLGQQCVNDESTFTFSFPAGTTATAGTYGSGTSNSAINGRTQSGTTVDYSIKFQIIVDGSGTVTLDNTNTHIIPQYMWQGDNVSVGDVIRIDAGSFGSLNNSITCTLTSDNVLASNGICNLNEWDTSQVTDFSFMFNHNSGRLGGKRVQNVNFGNWNLSSATDFNTFCNLGNPSGLKGTDLTPKNISAADSPTGSAYIAWDTSNVTNFNSFCYLGDVPSGILKYWRFNTTNNFSMSAMFYNMDLQSHISDEPCKTQVISSGDSNNPFGADYTAWNMDKCSSVSSFAYRQTSPPGMTVLTPALSSWQISDALTSFTNFSRAYSGSFTFTPTVGAWDPSGVSGSQYWHSTRSGQAWKFSTSAYDNLLDITNGWGGHASTVNSGVSLNMGESQYTAGGTAEQGRTALVNAGWTIVDGGAIYSNTNALSFNGSTEYIDTFYAPDSSLANAFSISAYVKASSINQSPGNTIIGTYDFTDSRARFYVNIQNTSGAYEFLVGFGSYQASLEISNFTLSQWNHIAVTYDGSNLKLYCNGGSPEHTISLSSLGSLPPLGSYDAHLYIGATNRFSGTQSVGQHWHGDIDEVMLWNTELTQGEVQAYDNVIGSGSIPDPNAITGLQLWNRMGD